MEIKMQRVKKGEWLQSFIVQKIELFFTFAEADSA